MEGYYRLLEAGRINIHGHGASSGMGRGTLMQHIFNTDAWNKWRRYCGESADTQQQYGH